MRRGREAASGVLRQSPGVRTAVYRSDLFEPLCAKIEPIIGPAGQGRPKVAFTFSQITMQ